MEDYFTFTAEISANLFAGRQHDIVCSIFKVALNLPGVEVVPALKRAWIQLRYEQPQIAAATENYKKVYEVPSTEDALQAWVDSTFVVVSDAENAEQFLKSVPGIDQATLYYLPKSSELTLRVHHQINDGIGSLQAMRVFFNVLANPPKSLSSDLSWGTEPCRLPLPLEEVLGHTPDTPPTPSQSEKGTARLMAYLSNLPAIGPVSTVGKTPAGENLTIERVLSPSTTAAIIQESKEMGITITSAVHAAYILMLQTLGDPDSNQSRYTGITAHNMRRHVPSLSNPKKATVGLYYAPQFVTIPLPPGVSEAGEGTTYTTVAKTLDEHYRTTIDDETLAVHGAFTSALATIVRSEEYQAAPIPADATMSSLGVLERCDIVLGKNTVHFWTFRENMHLVYSFNGAYKDSGDVEGYLEEMERVLRVELIGERDGGVEQAVDEIDGWQYADKRVNRYMTASLLLLDK
ncbi:hypothetical protein BJX70DRAFT_396839 [Aspergillus crustosus]